MATIKDKLVELIARNIAKEHCGDPNKSYQFYLEAEDTFKDLVLRVLAEKSSGDPLGYVECLENFQELCGWDYYDVWWLESEILK